jgi:hypothetical protein
VEAGAREAQAVICQTGCVVKRGAINERFLLG